MIKVSVIIPVYNAQAYIRECLDSLIHQTLRDIEIICINDCSSDSSLSIIEEYAANDDRIIIVNNEKNLGAGFSRNMGMQVAKGEYLSILDADDFFDLQMLESVYNQCISENADISIYDYANYDNDSKSITNCVVPRFLGNRIKSGQFDIKQTAGYIFQFISCAPWNKMYKRQFVLNSKIEFQNLKNANDVYFGIIILTQARQITYVDVGKPLLYYRTNTSTQISAHRQRHSHCIREAFVAVQKTLIENDNFNNYKGNFYASVINHFIHILCCTENTERSALYESIRFDWLKKLDMLNCQEKDFLSSFEYFRYKKFLFGEFDENCIKEFMVLSCLDHKRTSRLFEYVKEKNYRCGLWGIGFYGKAFLQVCNEYNYELSCVIDEDMKKAGMRIGNYVVKPFAQACHEVDAVIITNSQYGRDIVDRINEVNPNIKVIDVGVYYQLGVKIDECIL